MSKLSDENSNFRRHAHTVELRVRYAETDQMGYAYHGTFLTWMEIGRVELLRVYGHNYAQMEKGGLKLPVREAHMTYHTPAHYDDQIAMTTALAHMGKSRVTFESTFRRPADGALIAEGSVTLFCADADGKLCKVPDYIRALADGEVKGNAGG